MATGGLSAFRENAVYVGGAKQAAWGTGVVPTWYWLWLDGTDANPETKVATETEGDTSGFDALTWKQEQHEVVKIVEYGRPIIAGYALQSLLGTGSDTYGAPTANTTLSGAVVAGATQCPVVANLGNTGTLAAEVGAGYGLSGFEAVTLDLTTKTGTGPYTYTLANGATFKYAHNSAVAVISAASHALAPKFATFDPYSIEVGWATDPGSALQQATRYVDACCMQLDIESSKGAKVKFTSTWWATQMVKLSAFQNSYTFDTHNPWTHSDAANNWKLNAATTLNAATIEQFKLSLKRSTAADDCQAELLNPTYFLPGNITIDGSYQVLFNDWRQYYLTYFGNTASPAANATDVGGGVLVGREAFATTWQLDPVNSLALALPNITYSAAKLPMKRDARAVRQPVTFKAVVDRPSGITAPFTATLSNTQVGSY